MLRQYAANDSMDFERIAKFVYGFHRICGSVDELNEIGLPAHASPELITRAENLARKFEYILKNSASTADDELASTLHEATEVQSAIDALRS